jgi:FixJ family two-component response regulator
MFRSFLLRATVSVRAKKAGAVELLTKPLRDQDLLDAIQLALKRDVTRRAREAEVAFCGNVLNP